MCYASFNQYGVDYPTVAMFPWWLVLMIVIVLMVLLCCSLYSPKKRQTIQKGSSDDSSNGLKIFGCFARKYPDVLLCSDESSSAV